MNWNGIWASLKANWKTTLSGVLTTMVALSAAGFLAPNPYVNTKVSGWFAFLSGTAKIILSVMQKDAK